MAKLWDYKHQLVFRDSCNIIVHFPNYVMKKHKHITELELGMIIMR